MHFSRIKSVFYIVSLPTSFLLQLIGFIWGYAEQRFSYTVLTLGAGFALAVLVSKNSLN